MKLKNLLACFFLSSAVAASVNAQLVSDDIGVTQLLSPNTNANVCAGYNDLIVRVANLGDNAVTSFNVGWSFDNVVAGTKSYTHALSVFNQPNSTVPLNLGLFELQYNTPVLLKVWTTRPNNVTDGKRANDTLVVTLTATDPGIQLNDLNDTFLCYNASLLLDAGMSPYTDYTWSNGTQAQLNTILTTGLHWVWAYNNQGCQAFDTFMVEEKGEPAIGNLGIVDLGGFEFRFNFSNPKFVESATWNFGDGSPTVVGLGPVNHTYAQEGDYQVTLLLENSCGSVTKTQLIHVSNVTKINTPKDLAKAVNFYPNPTTDFLNITYPKNLIEIHSINIVNLLGQTVYSQVNPSDNIDISHLTTGMYNVVLNTSKGTTTKKVEVLR
jgi:hypothetical protein